MVLNIVAIVLAVCAIVYSGHCAIVFQKFNDGIKKWAENLDDSMELSINRSARKILRDMDEKISKLNEEKEEESSKDSKDDLKVLYKYEEK